MAHSTGCWTHRQRQGSRSNRQRQITRRATSAGCPSDTPGSLAGVVIVYPLVRRSIPASAPATIFFPFVNQAFVLNARRRFLTISPAPGSYRNQFGEILFKKIEIFF